MRCFASDFIYNNIWSAINFIADLMYLALFSLSSLFFFFHLFYNICVDIFTKLEINEVIVINIRGIPLVLLLVHIVLEHTAPRHPLGFALDIYYCTKK